MGSRGLVVVGLAAAVGCGGATTERPLAPAPEPAANPKSVSLPSLEGTWADATHALTIRGRDFRLRLRPPCTSRGCPPFRIKTGKWRRDGMALHLATTYETSFEDSGNILVLVPVAVAADRQPTLRLRRQRLPRLGGTAWTAGERIVAFPDDRFFIRDGPEGHLEGHYKLVGADLELHHDNATHRFAVLYDAGELVLIDGLSTIRYRPAPPRPD